MTIIFNINDRVHFKETPTMVGTIKEINSQGKIGVHWDTEDPHESQSGETVSFYPKHHLRLKDKKKRPRGNPNFSFRETNPAVISSKNHPVFPGLTCYKSATVQVPESVKAAIAKPDGTGIDENLYRKIQFLIRKHALKSTGCKSWEEFKDL